MEPTARRRLHQTFLAVAETVRPMSPLLSALYEALGRAPSPAWEGLYDQYFRIISAFHPNVATLIAALHHLALTGQAPDLALLFPSCGGNFRADQDQERLAQALEGAIQQRREEILDFLVTCEPRDPEVGRAVAVLLGAQAVVDRFGGGLSLVQLGAEDGLLLNFDRYSYNLGGRRLGEAPALIGTDLAGPISPALAVPEVVGRRGVGRSPVDLRAPVEQRLSEAFLPPDRLDRLERFRAACGLLPEEGGPRLVEGAPEQDLGRLLTEAYREMDPGNTLFLFSVLAWSRLDGEAQKRVALGLQSLAAQVQPRKPIAWLQVEPFTPGHDLLELRLHTFGWTDLEDRAVRRLAEAAPDLSWIRWLEPAG